MSASAVSAPEALVHITQQTVYLMGVSFVLGSLCTIFILLVLDMVRLAREEALKESFSEEDALPIEESDDTRN